MAVSAFRVVTISSSSEKLAISSSSESFDGLEHSEVDSILSSVVISINASVVPKSTSGIVSYSEVVYKGVEAVFSDDLLGINDDGMSVTSVGIPKNKFKNLCYKKSMIKR